MRGWSLYRSNTTSICPSTTNRFIALLALAPWNTLPNDYRSLEELFRIMKPDGRLIITHLPNRFSYTEFLARRLTKRNFHRRLYTVSGIGAMLKHNGFYPLSVRRHRFLPTNTLRSATRLLSPLEPLFERVWPLRLLCGDIIVIADRVSMM